MQQWEITATSELANIIEVVRSTCDAGQQAQVIALHGDLGAGKTTFTQQLAQSLGVSDVVTSPTFVVMKQYATADDVLTLLIHIDAYRLESPDELSVLGFTELLTLPNTLIVIEWAEKVADVLPADTIHLTFSIIGEQRRIEMTHGKSN